MYGVNGAPSAPGFSVCQSVLSYFCFQYMALAVRFFVMS